ERTGRTWRQSSLSALSWCFQFPRATGKESRSAKRPRAAKIVRGCGRSKKTRSTSPLFDQRHGGNVQRGGGLHFETYRDGTRACRFSQRRTCKNPAPPASRKWLATAQHRTRRTDPRSGVSGKEAARRYRPRQSANLRQSFRQADQGVLSSEPSNWRLRLLLRQRADILLGGRRPQASDCSGES